MDTWSSDRSRAQDLVKGLLSRGMTPKEISEALNGHVSMRTVYRWSKGDSVPQNKSNFQALIRLAEETGVGA